MQTKNGSAVDMQDRESIASSKRIDALARRRGSQASRRVSNQSARPMRIAPSNSSALSEGTQNGDGQDAASSPKGFRQRLTSMVQRGAEAATSFTSPLAQIYQPLVVDDDIVDQEVEPGSPVQHSQPPPPPPANISYGPDRKSTRLNSSHSGESRMPSSA